jgi:hypothetical protein
VTYQTYQHSRNYGCRVSEFILAGHRAVAMENEKLRVTLIADKGTDIYEFLYKPLDVDFMWRSWVGLRDRSLYWQSSPRNAGPHNDFYEGGWQELFPNCGAPSIHQGAEIGQHGEVLLLPWKYTIVRDDPDEIAVQFEVRTVRTPFYIVKTLRLRRGEPILRIHEHVSNQGGQPVDFSWGHHPALGWPFVDESCRVDLPPCRIRTIEDYSPTTSRLKARQLADWPYAESAAGDDEQIDLSRIPGPEVEASDMVFLEGIEDGWYAVTNCARRVGFALRYPADTFKVLWYWQVYRGGRDYPWWSATYNIALEPCSSYPMLMHAAARGEALSLHPGESRDIELMAIAYEGFDRVANVTSDGKIE